MGKGNPWNPQTLAPPSPQTMMIPQMCYYYIDKSKNNNNKHIQEQFSYVGTLETFHLKCNYGYNRKTYQVSHKSLCIRNGLIQITMCFPLHISHYIYFLICIFINVQVFKICSKVFFVWVIFLLFAKFPPL